MTYDTVTRPPTTEPRRRSGLGTLGRTVAVVLSLLLVVWGALSLVGQLSREDARSSATFRGATALEVGLGFESVEIRGSATATTVRMTRSFSWSFTRPTTSQSQSGGQVTVRSSCGFSPGRGCTGHVRLVVPEDLPVTVRTSDGSAVLHDLTGAVTVHTSDGHLSLRDISGPVDGSTSDGGIDATGLSARSTFQTRDGSLRATGLSSPNVTAESSDGSVELVFDRPPSTVTAQSRDGSVEVRVPDDGTAYRVSTDVSDGHEDVSVPTDPASPRRIDVRTSDGSITVGTAGRGA